MSRWRGRPGALFTARRGVYVRRAALVFSRAQYRDAPGVPVAVRHSLYRPLRPETGALKINRMIRQRHQRAAQQQAQQRQRGG